VGSKAPFPAPFPISSSSQTAMMVTRRVARPLIPAASISTGRKGLEQIRPNVPILLPRRAPRHRRFAALLSAEFATEPSTLPHALTVSRPIMLQQLSLAGGQTPDYLVARPGIIGARWHSRAHSLKTAAPPKALNRMLHAVLVGLARSGLADRGAISKIA
jgi:hypothetical protein